VLGHRQVSLAARRLVLKVLEPGQEPLVLVVAVRAEPGEEGEPGDVRRLAGLVADRLGGHVDRPLDLPRREGPPQRPPAAAAVDEPGLLDQA